MFPVTRKRFTAFVVFYGSDHEGFWRIFTARGWRHCAVILPVYSPGATLFSEGHAVAIQSIGWGVEVVVLEKSALEVAQTQLKEGATAALSIPIDLDMKRLYVPRGLLTCVSLIKAVLGLRGGWYVFTPKHLCRYLLRHGANFIGKP